MKNNNLIQEEINRAKQLWGYDTSKTIFEQTTGTSCMTVMTQNCPNTTPGFGPGLLGNCATINGQPVTQADVGRVVQQVSPPAPAGWANVNQVISSVQPQTQNMPGNIVVDFTITSCPNTNTNTGTTGGGTGTTTGTSTGNTGMITCYGCPGHMQPLVTQQFQGPAGAPPYNPDPNMNWGNFCGFAGSNTGGYISYWEDQSLVSAICNSGTTGGGTGTTTGTTGGQFPNNFNPSSWFSTFLSNAQAKPWYTSNKCQFFANRIQHWTNKLQGAGPLRQNMLNAKINEVTSYARQSTPSGKRCTNI